VVKKAILKQSKKILTIAALFLLIVGVFYVYSLSQIKLAKIQLIDANEITSSSFKLTGNIELENNGLTPVKVNHISYDVLYGKNNQKIMTGYVIGGVIPAKSTIKYPFTNEIKWELTQEIAEQLFKTITGEYLIGNVKLANFKVTYFDTPFSE